MQDWILVNYDGLGLFQIQARDESPRRDDIDDIEALRIVRLQARAGDENAMKALQAHLRDAPAIAALSAVL